MPKHRDYLYRRSGSQNWYVRIQYPAWLAKIEGRKKLEKSLGTSDRDEARFRAQTYINDYILATAGRKIIMKLKPVAYEMPQFEPNMSYLLADNIKAFTDNTMVSYFGPDGEFLKKEPIPHVVTWPPVAIKRSDFTRQELKFLHSQKKRYTHPDDELFITWFNQKDVSPRIRNMTLKIWSQFKEMTDNKRISDCTRSDGRLLVRKLIEQGNSIATVRKKVSGLAAAVNIAIDDNLLASNPFTKVIPVDKKIVHMDKLDENDMRLMRHELANMSRQDALLWKLLAFTGMRLDEPFQIINEHMIDGVRCVEVGTKTRASKRKLPIPTKLLDEFPNHITSQVFPGHSEFAGRRLRRIMAKVGISYDSKNKTGNPLKVLHSLRHRAKDRLRNCKCPLDVQHELLGHRRNFSEVTYGDGYSMVEKLKWIDMVGY